MQRRELLKVSAGVGALSAVPFLAGCAVPSRPAPKWWWWAVATAARLVAKYVRLLSQQNIDVVMVEPQDSFVSCPLSNLVLGGQQEHW